jgi:hypothetical protein
LKPAASSSFSAVGPTISLQAELRSAGSVAVVDDPRIAYRFTQDSLREIVPSSEILSCEIVVRSDEYCGQDEVYGALAAETEAICLAYGDQMI